jgi:deazaflavin-dependent oxidoreductase (nitroreductase family)
MSLRSFATAAFGAVNRVVLPAVEHGIGNPPRLGAGPVVVESIGRQSGEPRRTPLLSIRVGDRVAISTIRSGSDWMANVQADPHVRVRLFGHERDADAEVFELALLRVALLRLE